MSMQRIRTWTIVSVIAITLLLVFGLYQKALFFTPVQLYMTTGLVLFGLVTGIALGGWRLQMPIWLILAFGYACYALLTTLWAANAEYAIEGAVMIAGAVLLAVIATVLPYWAKRYLLTLLAALGPAVYLFGLGVVLKLWSYASASMPDNKGNVMMNSVFQYHNTFGAFELVAFVLNIALMDGARKWYVRAVYLFSAAITVLGVLSSYSREVWLLLPVAAILIILAQWLRKRPGRTVLNVVYAVMVGLGAAGFGIQALTHASKHYGLYAMLTVVLGAAVLSLADIGLAKFLQTKQRQVAVFSALGVIVVAAIAFLVHKEGHKLGSIASRVSSIQLKDFSVQQRILFYQAALHMWTHNPIFGGGWGTWTAKFLAFQQYPYEATLVHSVVLDNLVNGGIIGFALWVAMLIFAIVSGIKAIRTPGKQSALSVAGLVAAVIMLLHGALDFDFSFGLITATFFLLLGLSVQPQPPLVDEQAARPKGFIRTTEDLPTHPKWVNYASPSLNILMGAGACILIIVGAMLSVAEHWYTKATGADAGVPTVAESDLTTGIQWASYYANLHTQLAELYMNDMVQAQSAATSSTSSTTIQQDAQNAWQQAQLAAKQDPWNPATQQVMASIAYRIGQDAAAYQWALRSAQDSPFHVEYPTTYMGIGLWSSVLQYKQNPTLAQSQLRNVGQQLPIARSNVEKQKHMTFGYLPSWTYQVESPMQIYAGAADYAIGNYKVSLTDMDNLSQTGRNADLMGLYDIITLLDNQRLHPGYTDSRVLKEIQANTTFQQEYTDLAALRPTK